MKTGMIIGVIVVGLSLLVFREVRFSRQMAAARAEREAMAAEVEALHEQLQSLPADIKAKLEQAQSQLEVAESRINQMTTRAANLERRLQAVQAAQAPARPPRGVPGGGVDSWEGFDTAASEPPAEYRAIFPKRSRWGPEEVTGPPDTEGSGDIVTAWASARPDTGPEWLALAYDRPVDIAEVRIRETHNPGAISKVTAFLSNGTEVVLWEGESTPGQAPNDFVVPVTQSIAANQIKVYVDSQRVPGWNEIDAVELVGKDGSRQWASNASASSTYAEPQARSGLDLEPTRRLQLTR